MKVYTGIGSRETPAAMLTFMEACAIHLGHDGWTLRSGSAPGADQAFESGAFSAYFTGKRVPKPELYLPWPRFEGRRATVARLEQPQPAAFSVAAAHHPAWDRLSEGAQKLHARNVHQILGPDLDALNPIPSRFVLCWTPGAEGGGGTGQAIRIARAYDVPVFDLADEATFNRVREWVRA